MASATHQTTQAAYVADQIAALPSLEPSEDLFTRLGTWDDSVSGVLRPVPSTDIPVVDNLSFNFLSAVGASSTSETSLLTSTYSIGASDWKNGTRVRMRLSGQTTNATGSGVNTLTIRISLGTPDIATVAFSVPQSASAANPYNWVIDTSWVWTDFIGSRPVGGYTAALSQENSAANEQVLNAAMNSGVTVDLTSALALDVSAQNSVSSSSTSTTLLLATIEVSNET